MHYDLFGMDLDDEELKELAFGEDEMKRIRSEKLESLGEEYSKGGLEDDGPGDLEESKKEAKRSLILLDKIKIARCFLIAALLFGLKLVISIFSNSMIIALGASFTRILSALLGLSAMVPFLFIIKYSIDMLKNSNEMLRSVEEENNSNTKIELLTKEKYIGISEIKKDLNSLKLKVSKDFKGEPGEDTIAKNIINQCLDLLKRIESLQSALKMILSRSEEYSLEEVINTLKHAEENIGKNIFKVTNRIVLELNVEGFDKGQIDKYLQNNEDILTECTKLVKESLEYIESKDSLEDNTIGIETLTETLQSLKKQLDKGGKDE